MRIQFWREEKEEERSSWKSLLIPIALLAGLFWLLPRLKEEEQETDYNQGDQQRQSRQRYVSAQEGQRAREGQRAQESRQEQERQSSLQRQHMRQDQVQPEQQRTEAKQAGQYPKDDSQQKDIKQTQAKERDQGKTGEREETRASGGRGRDKLEEIEGIGPKTAEVLRGHNITTFRQLADTSVERLNEIMDEAGFRINPPDTWPEQARYAADGDWDGLKQLKDRLQAGRPEKGKS